MTAVKVMEQEVMADDEEVVTDPGIPAVVEGEATRLIRLTLSKLDEGLDVAKSRRGAIKRLADVCTPAMSTSEGKK